METYKKNWESYLANVNKEKINCYFFREQAKNKYDLIRKERDAMKNNKINKSVIANFFENEI